MSYCLSILLLMHSGMLQYRTEQEDKHRSATMDIFMETFWLYACILLTIFLGVELLCHKIRICLTFIDTIKLLWLIQLRLFAAAAAAKSLQSCPNSVRPHRRQPTRLPRPWDSPGKNTGVGCHFLLQCMKVKSESEFAQSCTTLSDPMDYGPPGSSIHGIFQARVLEWGAIAFSIRLFICSLSNSWYFLSYLVSIISLAV